ncbi:MAG: tRNA uridine-5-carboxymethylaminomethyl(34) synthesis GTPase MnmE [Thiohalocapsa sp.]|uniref:tRNA uridine-5-carboxymethylaminomethyl(34) synthesis GTPase MnmE n=1 Tax=Thiohalocapsa sp. TaxID=2497641 RepID=UPI0025E4CB51|nr:tRNA uridine-5-carboxymethylaminomethyl(34) synthesis GTPase MnmE [Thiohalocapsa sp.]MCG6941235.1 tRNA uridine-5-carboxymethylaminomethyl(34) synthesis GTPase MnmE [Thiohalocapsa sp.]
MTGRDTIAAIATPPGVGAVGILRISGPRAADIAVSLLGRLPQPRRALLARFLDADGEAIDQGLALYFPAPHSFTGEDVLEFQGHGGPVVLDRLLARLLALGARAARPGEFTERAFLEGKLDLTRAEAIADLIASGTEQQARLAARSLQGAFARRVEALLEALTAVRVLLEATLDFPDEDLDPRLGADIEVALARLLADVDALLAIARRGERLRDGLLVVLAGAPNAGKSSLLNALLETDRAIVTPIPGTTRDLLHADVQIDGLPLRVVDTAGLRLSLDPIEQEGVRRAREQIDHADLVLWVIDDADPQAGARPPPDLPAQVPVLGIRNKIDLTGRSPGECPGIDGTTEIACSATTGAGLDALRRALTQQAGLGADGGGEFSARRRHLDALRRTGAHLRAAAAAQGEGQLPELVAEDLRLAQRSLGEITGAVSSDELLGRIFNEFCIGK